MNEDVDKRELVEQLQVAFVQGAAWWEYYKTGGTMWASDRHLAHEEAMLREENSTLGIAPFWPSDMCEKAGDGGTQSKLTEQLRVVTDALDGLFGTCKNLYAICQDLLDTKDARLVDARGALTKAQNNIQKLQGGSVVWSDGFTVHGD